MINHISIKDFAIIEQADIEFRPGLNIMTGETGAGKSIVIEAVSLALGARADASYVRTGCDKAIVQLAGDLDGEEIVLTREVSASGKNLCRLNGSIVTLTELGTYCKRLADIHGQYDHQSLLNPDNHLHLVDIYHHAEIDPVKERLASIYKSYNETKNALARLVEEARENARKRDFTAFEVSEIRAAGLVPGEDRDIEERISILENAERIYDVLAHAYSEGHGDDYGGLDQPPALSILSGISSSLSNISGVSAGLDKLREEFDDLYYRLEDIFSEIRTQRDSMTYDKEELDTLIGRLELIKKLKSKYGDTIEDVLSYAEEAEAKLYLIDNMDNERERLTAELATLTSELTLACDRLTVLRRQSAEELEEKIISELHNLNFAGSELEISFDKLSDYTQEGIDKVEFLISTNRGEPLKPLAKIASGGEMSRIMLAFKSIIADYDNIPTMIFDEIDTGISGITASVVGRKLQDIASDHQIICITHLPQIAAAGDTNFRIEKIETVAEADLPESQIHLSPISEDAEESAAAVKTRTEIRCLKDDEKVYEIARLLGGDNITETTLASARELIGSMRTVR